MNTKGRGKDMPIPRYMLTCDLLFWEGEKAHIFFQWGKELDSRFKYREIMVTVYWTDKEEPERIKIFYARHNDQAQRSVDLMVRTAIENLDKITKPIF